MTEQTAQSKADRHHDRALEQSFPASDPVQPKSVTGTEDPGSDIKRKAPKISRHDVEAAAQQTAECPECNGIGRVVPSEE